MASQGLAISDDRAERQRQLKVMPSDEIRRLYGVVIAGAANALYLLADMAAEMRERGEPLAIDPTFAAHLDMIRAGRLHPEIERKYGGRATTLRAITALPIEDQEQLARADAVDVAEQDAGGQWTHRRVPIAELTPRQVRQVFDGPRVRSCKEQERWATRATTPPAAPRRRDTDIRATLDAAEAEAFFRHVRKTHRTQSELIREALRAAGYLKG